MKILWIGKRENGDNGDDIYDRKMIAASRRLGAEVVTTAPKQLSRLREFAGLLAGVPVYRSRYARSNVASLTTAMQGCDFAICSGEHLDWLAFQLPGKILPILHNVSSLALSSIYRKQKIGALAAFSAAQWEKQAYGSGRFPVIVALSRSDAAFLSAIAPAAKIVFAPPGMPPAWPLEPGARFSPEILLSGTFDWSPKRRDVEAFAREYAAEALRLPIYADDLPETAAAALAPLPLQKGVSNDAIRLGLIPDRFNAGHKLKTTYYIANNAIVLTYADVAGDFAEIEDHAFFIRRISHVSEIRSHVDELMQMPPDALAERMRRFKAACARRFSWEQSSQAMMEAAQSRLF